MSDWAGNEVDALREDGLKASDIAAALRDAYRRGKADGMREAADMADNLYLREGWMGCNLSAVEMRQRAGQIERGEARDG